MLDFGIYNMDCMIGMKEFPDKYFELAIVDPPYGLDRYKKKDGGNSKKIKSFGGNTESWNNEPPQKEYFNELARVSKNQIIWGGNNFELPRSEYFIVWDKGQFMPSFARCEYAWTNSKIPAKIFEYRSQDKYRIHPTQKPVALYAWILNNYAKKGDKILDTHLGSGSSAIACYDLGFDFIGFEIDKEYFESAQKRINDHKAQISIFTMQEEPGQLKLEV